MWGRNYPRLRNPRRARLARLGERLAAPKRLTAQSRVQARVQPAPTLSSPPRPAATPAPQPPPRRPPQVGLASAVAGVVGAYLTGEFELDDMHTTSCGLSMRGSSICTAAYLAAAVTCVLSLLMIAMQVGGLRAGVVRGCGRRPDAVRAGQVLAVRPAESPTPPALPLPPRCRSLAQCATMEGRVGLGFCGPILSSVGFFWWLSYGAAATSASMDAADWDTTLTAYRMGEAIEPGGSA